MLRPLPAGLLVMLLASCSILAQEPKRPGQAPAAASKNLLADPSMEDSAVGAATPAGWGGFFAQPDSAYTSQVVEGGRTGKKSLVVEGRGDFGVASANLVPLDRKKRDVVRGWVKVEGDEDAAADVKIHYHDAAGG